MKWSGTDSPNWSGTDEAQIFPRTAGGHSKRIEELGWFASNGFSAWDGPTATGEHGTILDGTTCASHSLGLWLVSAH